MMTALMTAAAGLASALAVAAPAEAALEPRLLANVQTVTRDSGPDSFLEIAGTAYMRANDEVHGAELWKTNGTAAGTTLVRDVNPGTASGSPTPVGTLGGLGYFAIDDGTNGRELWKTDGTAGGTTMVANISPGAGSSSPSAGVSFGGHLYFSAGDSLTNRRLWRTDGTAIGTVQVDALVSASNPAVDNLTVFGGKLYFTGRSTAAGFELWRTSGAPGAEELVADIVPGSASSEPRHLVSTGSRLYFDADTAALGRELWSTDGVETQLVEDVAPGSADGLGFTETFCVSTTRFYFTADDGTHGEELWSSTGGTPATTGLVADVNPGAGGGASLTGCGAFGEGELAFTGSASEGDTELWRTDGSEGGTEIVAELAPGADGSGPTVLRRVDDFLYVSAFDPTYGAELHVFDTSTGDLRLLKDLMTTPEVGFGVSQVVELGSKVLFNGGEETHGREPFITDGTTAGTQLIADINEVDDGSTPGNFAALGGDVVFAGQQPASRRYVFRSDGSSTALLDPLVPRSGSHGGFTPLGAGLVWFTGISIQGWSGSAGSTETLLSPFTAIDLTPLGGRVLFGAREFATSNTELWSTDGTVAGTNLVKEIRPGTSAGYQSGLTVFGGSAYFAGNDGSTGAELWRSDGTEAGTELFKDTVIGAAGGSPAALTVVGGKLFFIVGGGTSGKELWVSDGTPAGTKQVLDLNPGAGDGVLSLAVAGGVLYMAADDGTSGLELWRSDGTPAGTVRVADIVPGAGSSSPEALTAVGSTLFFTAEGGEAGRELWASDGTAAGTRMVADLRPFGTSEPNHLTAAGSVLAFTADDGTHGREVFESDGTEAGTRMLADIRPGATSSSPGSLAFVNGALYFSASDGVVGSEPWIATFAPPPGPPSPPASDPAPPPAIADRTVAKPRLKLAARQRLSGPRLRISLRAGAAEAVTVAVTGKVLIAGTKGSLKLAPARGKAAAGKLRLLRPSLAKGSTGRLRGALASGSKARAQLTVRIVDSAGNAAVLKRTVRLGL